MFQAVNHLFVLATLLSTGIGGLATPTPRQTGTVTIVSQTTKLCLDVGDGTIDSQVVFNTCSNGESQQFVLLDVSTGTQVIKSISSSNCAGIGDGDFITSQDCDLSNGNLEWLVVPDVATPAIGNLNELCIAEDSNHKAIATACSIKDNSQFIAAENN